MIYTVYTTDVDKTYLNLFLLTKIKFELQMYLVWQDKMNEI